MEGSSLCWCSRGFSKVFGYFPRKRTRHKSSEKPKCSHSAASTIVIDAGSSMCKAGFARESLPKIVFPTVYTETEDGEVLFGDEALSMGDDYTMKFPVQRGVVNSWEDMEKIWNHAFFDQLNIDPEDNNVILTDVPLTPPQERERVAQIMFECFRIGNIYISMNSALSLYASGRTTGVVLDTGDGATHTVPIYEGYSYRKAIFRLDLAGTDITEYMQRLLQAKGVRNCSYETAKKIKEQLCYVSTDYDHDIGIDIRHKIEKIYQLPDGQEISVGRERFKCPEILFKPSLIGTDMWSIQAGIAHCIDACEEKSRKDLSGNIVLSGGNSLFQNTAKRLYDELIRQAPPGMKINISAPPKRKYSTWIGGSLLGSLSTFESMCVSKKEYKDCGPSIINKKLP